VEGTRVRMGHIDGKGLGGAFGGNMWWHPEAEE